MLMGHSLTHDLDGLPDYDQEPDKVSMALLVDFLGHMWQVVVGVLGCPNLPTAQLRDEDGTGNSAEKAGSDGVGVIFAAQKGCGAFAGPLAGVLLAQDAI